MKINYGSYAVGALCTLLLAVSCEKDDSATKPQVPFATVLASGGYWQEDIRLVYLDENGQKHISENTLYKDAIRGVGIHLDNSVIGPYFYIDPVSPHKVHKYKLDDRSWDGGPLEYFIKPLYYLPDYFKFYPRDLEYIYVDHEASYIVREQNAMARVNSRSISISQDEMVWEVPIKSYIYQSCGLGSIYDGYDFPYRRFLYLQATWTRITDPEVLEILAQTPTYEEYEKTQTD